jgi:hypothetical protein
MNFNQYKSNVKLTFKSIEDYNIIHSISSLGSYKPNQDMFICLSPEIFNKLNDKNVIQVSFNIGKIKELQYKLIIKIDVNKPIEFHTYFVNGIPYYNNIRLNKSNSEILFKL